MTEIMIGILVLVVVGFLILLAASDMMNPTGSRFSTFIRLLLLPFSAIVYGIMMLFSAKTRLNVQKKKKKSVDNKPRL